MRGLCGIVLTLILASFLSSSLLAQTDTTAPTVSSATVDGATLVVTFSEDLASVTDLTNTAFTVKKTPSGGSEASQTLSGTPTVSGKTLTLTLSSSVVASDAGTVKVSYTAPSAASAKLRDAADNAVENFTDQKVVNLKGGVCPRTKPVRDVIVEEISDDHPGVNYCDEVTSTHLAGITQLNIQEFRSLSSGDFAGLTKLARLSVSNRDHPRYVSLPEDLFEGLTELTELNLFSMGLTTLPEDLFNGLTKMRVLRLHRLQFPHDLTARRLSEDLLDGMSQLYLLDFNRSPFRYLPANFFDDVRVNISVNVEGTHVGCIPKKIFNNDRVTIDTNPGVCPVFTLSTEPVIISENGGVATVKATLDKISGSGTEITISVEPVSPATDSDYNVSTNKRLYILEDETTSTGTVTITAVNNTVDGPDLKVKVKGVADNLRGLSGPIEVGRFMTDDVELTITNDNSDPAASLTLAPASIGEDGKVSTVTAKLDKAASTETRITVSAEAVSPATDSDFTLSENKVLTIAQGETSSTGTVTITSVDNEVDAPDKMVTVRGTASTGVTNPEDLTLTIIDDDTYPTATLALTSSSIGEAGKVSTVTATLDEAASSETTITVSAEAVSPATDSDFTLSENKVLTIAQGETSSTGTVTITSVDNEVDAPDKEVTVRGTASTGVTNPADLTLTITDDDAEPTVELRLSRSSISEQDGQSVVTAALSRASGSETTIKIEPEPGLHATTADYRLGATTDPDATLTIPAGAIESIGDVWIDAVDNQVDAPNKTVTVKGTATNMHGVTNPPDTTLTITDNEGTPTVTLVLTPTSIGEDGKVSTVTATLNYASSQETTITVSAAAVSPATAADFTLSANKTLTIAAGQTTSTGVVTITAVDNQVDAPDKTVTVSGMASNDHGVNGPSNLDLTIMDDDAEPTATLVLTPSSIGEDAKVSTVTATLDQVASTETTITVSAEAVSPAQASDYTLSSNTTLTIAAGATSSTGTVTLTSVDNEVDAPDKTVTVSGDASAGVRNPAAVTLTINDDEAAPTVTLDLSSASISENAASTTVTARLDRASSAETKILVSISPGTTATASDYGLGTNQTLTIAAGATTSTGTVTITSVDNQVDAPDKTVQVQGTATNTQGITNPTDVELTITDDDVAPTVTLGLSSSSIGEDGESTTVTATLDRASSEATTITISAEATSPATDEDYTLSTNRTLTIAAGATTSTGTVTITSVNDQVDAPNKMVIIRGAAINTQGIANPTEVELTIADDEETPTVTLVLSPALIGEAGESTTVAATLNRASSSETTITISAMADEPAVDADFTLSANRTLTIAAGTTTSTGVVTITAVDNDVDAPDKTVQVKGTATNTQGITNPVDVELTITDGTPSPAVTLVLSSTSIGENADLTTVTATLSRSSSVTTTITVSAVPDAPATDSDVTLSANTMLTIAAGETASTGLVTITAVDNQVDAPNKTVQVKGAATNTQGIINPTDVELTITDDDAAPTVRLVLSPSSISENAGRTTVTAILNRASSAATTITVSAAADAPAVAADFTLSANRALTIAAGATTSTGVVTITAMDNQVNAPNKTVQVNGSAINTQGITDPANVGLTITDDDAAPTVTLVLSPGAINENGGRATVTARLNRASSAATTITVSAVADAPAVASDFALSGNTILTIAAGATISTGVVTITAVDNQMDAPDKTMQVQGVATNTRGVNGPAAAQLIITDDEVTVPVVTLVLTPTSIRENADRTTVTATLDQPSTAITTITVSALANIPATDSDYTLSQNTTLTIAAGATTSTGIVTITAVDNLVSAPDKTVQVQGTATNQQGVTGPAAALLTITDDEVVPTVTLMLDPGSISENEGRTSVTATLDRASSAATTITVSALPEPPATDSDYGFSTNKTLTIAAGATTSTGVVTITTVDNPVSAPDKTIQIQGTATNRQGVTGPAAVPLTITDDEERPTVTLMLDPGSISENEGRTSVTATLDRASSAVTTITVSALPEPPATASDYTLSQNTTLTIAAGATTSTGLVTITAVDNPMSAPDKTVQVQGTATNRQGVTGPAAVQLTITDDEEMPTVTLMLDPGSISEKGAMTSVTATLDRPSSAVTTITVSVLPEPPATDSDYRFSANKTLTIAAGAITSTGVVTITAVDNLVDEPDKTVHVKGTASNGQGITDPSDVALTLLDDDAAPMVMLALEPESISEKGGRTSVTATLDRPSSAATTITITVLPDAPAAASDITLSQNLTLTITAGDTESTGLVTITAVDNNVDRPDKTVQVQGTATNRQGVASPSNAVLTIIDDDASPPMASDATVTTEEDTPYRFAISDFGYSDAEGHVLAAVRIERHPDAGTLTLGDTRIRAGTRIAATRIAADELVFTPLANAYGPAHTSFDFKVSNGTSESPLAATMTINVTPTNDVATGMPRIVGSMQVGQQLRVSVEEILDPDGMLRAQTGEPGYAYRYQWLGKDQQEPIAQGNTYTPVETDAGTTLVVRVAFVDDAGFEEILESPPRQVRYISRIRTAYMGRLGRTLADQILQATQCEGRRPERSEAYLAGQALSLDALPNYVHLQEVEPDRLAALLGDSNPTYRLDHSLTRERLLRGSSFRQAIQNRMAIWGRGAMSRIQGAEGALNLEARVFSGIFGADWVGDKGNLGVLVAHTRSEGDYTVETGEGDLSGHLVGVYPNACYAVTSGLTAWAVVGYGLGSMTVEQVPGPVDLQMLGAGVYGRIRTVAQQGLEVGIRSDALMVQMSADITEDLPEARAQVTRLRLGLQGAMRGIRLGTQSTIEPVAELALRHDGGDAETGFGVDLRVGVVFNAPASGLSMEVSTRTVLTHQDRRFQEQGLSGVVIWDARPQSSEGLQIRLEQTIGAGALDNAEDLLRTESIQPYYTARPMNIQAGNLRLQAGYGFALFSNEVTLQPEFGFRGWGPQRRYEMGWNLSRTHERPTNMQLFVGATGQTLPDNGPLQLQHLIRLQLKRLF